MKAMTGKLLESYRITSGPLASIRAYGFNGLFNIPVFDGPDKPNILLRVICSDGRGWDHVSVSIPGAERCPSWEEMCLVKELFFRDEETVIQFHPKRSAYVNFHPYTLHLWRRQDTTVELPPSDMIGPSKFPPLPSDRELTESIISGLTNSAAAEAARDKQ